MKGIQRRKRKKKDEG